MAVVIAAGADASGERSVNASYLIGTSSCGLPTPMVSRHCFEVAPGETWIEVVLTELSPTKELDLPIAAAIRFLGVPSITYTICGSGAGPIDAGATGVEVEIQQGERAGFCAPFSNDVSPALKGTIDITFTS